MDKTGIICNLKENNYSFKDNGEQIIVELARKYFLKLYIENDHIAKDDDMLKTSSWLTNEKSLKVATKRNMIAFLIFILPFVLMWIFDPHFFSNGGKYFFIMFVPLGLQPLLEFWYYNKRLSKIKKLLKLND